MLKCSKSVLTGAAGAVLAGASLAHGAVVASYNFTAGLAASTVDANATATAITPGSTTTTGSANDYYVSKPVLTVVRTSDTVATDYFQTTLTAATGYTLNLSSFTFDGARGGASTPRTYDVHTSVAGLQPTDPSLGSGQFTAQRGAAGATDTLPTLTFDLSGAAYQNLPSLTVRVYFYTPTTSQAIDIDNVTLNGTVAAATPEPAAAAAGLGLLGLLARRRRQTA